MLHPNLSRYQPLEKLWDWRVVVTLTLAFWLGASSLLDFVVMPGLFMSGMMTQDNFPMAGYTIFSVFNRLELLCAALVLTGVLVLCRTFTPFVGFGRTGVILSLFLLATVLIYTYDLTPEMTALGTHFNIFESASQIISPQMEHLHLSYWGLEALKLLLEGILLTMCVRCGQPTTLNECP